MEKVIIIDVSGAEKFSDELTDLGLVVTEAAAMTRVMENWFGWEECDPQQTVLVFPGSGANIVRQYLNPTWLAKWRGFRFYAKRFWQPGEDPQVVAERIFPDQMVVGVKRVVVIDDVFSSGQTAKLVREKNYAWIPGADWWAVGWISQRAVSLKGFSRSFTAEQFGTKTKKVPINSLSTLLADINIAQSYAMRNFERPEEFLSLLDRFNRKSA